MTVVDSHHGSTSRKRSSRAVDPHQEGPPLLTQVSSLGPVGQLTPHVYTVCVQTMSSGGAVTVVIGTVISEVFISAGMQRQEQGIRAGDLISLTLTALETQVAEYEK